MWHSKSRTRPLILGLLLGAMAASPAYADDTEVFKANLSAQSSALVKPNVMFVIDTSGSMSGGVTGTAFPYDPSLTYAGACVTTRVYWSTTGTTPDCSTTQFFNLSQLRCDATAAAINAGGNGTFQDRVARYDSSGQSWETLSNGVPNPAHVECRADRGVHGETTASATTYIANGGAGPYQLTSVNELNWESTGDFYTLYSGNFMNYFNNPPTGTPTRLQIVQAAVNQVVSANRSNISAGLMRFDTKTYCTSFLFGVCVTSSGNKGGPVIFPVQSISADADLLGYQSAVASMNPEGFTPLAETLYEAARYYRGEAPLFGTNPPTANTIQSVSSSMSGGNYISPITGECQKNFIVYLTDGEPTVDGDADSQIGTLIAGGSSMSDASCSFSGGDDCLDEVAEFLAEEDASALPGTQTVRTYTISFLIDPAQTGFLKTTASKGNGEFFEAKSALSLTNAFNVILTDIQEEQSTFSSPSVSVNAFNRITNRDELFFSLFTPAPTYRWPGNIKRFQLDCEQADATNPGFCADLDSDGEPDAPIIVDAAGNAAVDDTTGFFKDNARSVWTPAAAGADGANTELGGAANVFGGLAPNDDPNSRVNYTYTGAYTVSNGVSTPSATNVLSDSSNAFIQSNAAVTNAMFYPGGGPGAGDPTRDQLVDWLGGIDLLDVDDDLSLADSRHQLGDGLHTKPVLVEYGPDEANSDITLYNINNEGFLHAIDIDTGNEVFSFIPAELLDRGPDLFKDEGLSPDREYGLDGPLTVWFNDKDNDGVLDSASPDFEHVYLFFGQRRGGKKYYAVDVTDRSNPKLLWKIDGDTGNFAELGQSWSAMQVAKIKVNGTETDVLVFGGGYDDDQDTATTPADDDEGRAVFIVNANTGQLIWMAGKSGISPTPNLQLADMTNSIPADVNVFDLTGDGLADRIYVGDTRGQIWRFDINNDNAGVNGDGSAGSKLVYGSKLAELQKETASFTPGVADNRRFFFQVDVSFAAPEDAPPFLALAIGSGYRAHPLNTAIKDRFYMVRDPHIGNFTDNSSFPAAVNESDLVDLTTNLTPTAGQLVGTQTNLIQGWYISLTDESTGNFVGEKVLADALTFNNVILFTTFTPPSTPLTADCEPNQGDGRVFAVNLFDGSPVQDLDDSGSSSLTRSDRSLVLLRSGIPPSVIVLFSKLNGVTPVGFVAAEQLKVSFSDAPVRTYWYQQETE